MTVDDAWFDAPHGVPAQGSVKLRLTLEDVTGARGVALTRATRPHATGAVLYQNGETVHAIPLLPDASAVDLEWNGSSGITLTGLRHAVSGGSFVPVTLHYDNGSSQTMQVVAGPLGGISAQHGLGLA